MNLRLLIDIALATSAQADMIKAIQVYHEATEAVKSASDDIASKWEGDAKEAFVENERNAYTFYIGIKEIATGAAETVKKIIDDNSDMIQQFKNIVSKG